MSTAILIIGRLKSLRLTKKATLPILGKPMINHMIDRLRLAQRPDQIILCTSWVEQDDPLEEVAKRAGIGCFRGDPEDVLVRITEAAEQFGVETVVSCTADNPFIDPIYIDKLVDFHHEHGNDYSKAEGLPLGVATHVLSIDAMRRACEIKATEDSEFYFGYFTDTGMFKAGYMDTEEPLLNRPDLRMTVDTPEDFAFVTKIFADLYRKESIFSLEEIIRHLNAHPEIVQINASIVQRPAKPIQLKASAEMSG